MALGRTSNYDQCAAPGRRRTISVDDSLKIRILPNGRAEAEAYCDDQPETFPSRARAKGRAARSQDISDFCNRWALKWEGQNGIK
jgi:hypothetical protein